MANCDTITKGLAELSCKNTVAGLKAIYMIPYGEYDFTKTSDDVDGHVVKDMGINEAVKDAFRFPLKNTGNTFTEPAESSRDNGTTVFQPTLNFIVTKINAQMQYQMKLLSWGRPIIVMETNAGDFLMLGSENGMEVVPTTNVEGELTGANNYSFEATGEEREPSYFLTGDAVTALKAIVSSDNI